MKLFGQDTHQGVIQSLSNCSHKLFMMKGSTLLTLGNNVKGQINSGTQPVKPCEHNIDYIFCPINFQTSHTSWLWWEENPYWFRVSGSTFKVNFVCAIQTTFCVQSHSNFTCKLWLMGGGALLIFGHGVKGKGQLWHLVDTIQITVFAQSHSIFTRKLWLMGGGTLLIFGHGVKDQSQILYCL